MSLLDGTKRVCTKSETADIENVSDVKGQSSRVDPAVIPWPLGARDVLGAYVEDGSSRLHSSRR